MRTRRAAWLGVVAVVGGCTTLLGLDDDYYLVEVAAGAGGAGEGGAGGAEGVRECSTGELGCEANAPRYCREDRTAMILRIQRQ